MRLRVEPVARTDDRPHEQQSAYRVYFDDGEQV